MTASVHGTLFFMAKKVAYSTTKAAVTAMGKCLHAEVGPQNVQVNVVLPGSIQTKLLEDNRQEGQIAPEADPPESIAPLYLFLASDLSVQRYKGKVIDQYSLMQLMPRIQSEISEKDYNIKDIFNSMKKKMNRESQKLFRINLELIDFLIRYKL